MQTIDIPSLQANAPAGRIVREAQILEQVVFVGGHPGCGKTMLTPILGGLDRVEIQKYNYSLEHVCSLKFLNKISDDVTQSMVRMMLDLDIYNMLMSREANFRFSDLSSIFKNPGTWRYLKRMFGAGDEKVIERMKLERPILQIVFHNLLAISAPLFQSLGERMSVVEVVRHPLYMLKQWYLYVERYGNDPRDFTIWYDHKGRSLPFFAYGWEDRYLASNTMDKVIFSIDELNKRGAEVIASLPENLKKKILFVPFEQFVLNPDPIMEKIESLLGTKVIARTRREMKRQKVPRKKIADGINLEIYKMNGWQPGQQGLSEQDELAIRRQYAVDQKASSEGLAVLDRLCADYEQKYMRKELRP